MNSISATFRSCLTVLVITSSGSVNLCADDEIERANEDGFESLFDGKTLKGWSAIPKNSAGDWTVKNGVIVASGSAKRLSYLVWKDRKLTNLDLRFEYRMRTDGNTGVEIRAVPDRTGKRPFEGYHADFGDVGLGPNVLGAWDFHFAKRTEHSCLRGTRMVMGRDGSVLRAKIDGAITVSEIRKREWNSVRVVARDDNFQFFINNKPAAEFTDKFDRGRLSRGAIGLQLHDKGMVVEFKNIRLKKLRLDQ